jgi:L-seryl-tRNA(Ser) seleniumtransferase
MDDVGSGVLIDLSRFGLPAEPTVQASVAAGADIVTFSGDKLLGGPQAGIIVGRQDLIERIRRHPLNRALRIDKLTLAALEATLRLYLDEQAALREIPTLAMLTADPATLRTQAEGLAHELTTALGAAAAVETVAGFSAVGGGALPEVQLPTTLVAVRPHERTVAALEEALRQRPLPVLARIQDNALLLDVRTLRAGEMAELTLALAEALA